MDASVPTGQAPTAVRLREDVLEPVGHAQWVFTVPKMLRPYFLRHRELLGGLCRAAWQTVHEMMAAAAGEDIRPGMVAVVQTFGSKINFHPHVHAIVSRGGWTKAGQWVAVPYVDARAAAAQGAFATSPGGSDRGGADRSAALMEAQWILSPQHRDRGTRGSRRGRAAGAIPDALAGQ